MKKRPILPRARGEYDAGSTNNGSTLGKLENPYTGMKFTRAYEYPFRTAVAGTLRAGAGGAEI